jgi:hypothetical protein
MIRKFSEFELLLMCERGVGMAGEYETSIGDYEDGDGNWGCLGDRWDICDYHGGIG